MAPPPPLAGLQVVTSNFEETLPKHMYTGAEYARHTASHKAVDVASTLSQPADLVVGADTVVEVDGVVLEKPVDAADARRMLSMLSDRTHQVHTGVALALPPQQEGAEPRLHSFVISTTVEFAALTEAGIAAYVASGEPFGKAGAYGIQGSAASFVRRLDGCYFSVVGFPLHAFCSELAALIESRQLAL